MYIYIGGDVAVELHSVMTARVYCRHAYEVVCSIGDHVLFLYSEVGGRSRAVVGMVGSVFDLDQYATSASVTS